MQSAIDRLLAEGELRRCWERYHLVGQVLRRQTVGKDARLVAAHVRDALAGEISKRENSSRGTASGPTRVSTGDRSRPVARLMPTRWRQFAPLATALAAAFTLVGILAIPDEPGSTDRLAAGPAGSPDIASTDRRWERNDSMIRAKLEQLVVSHHERAPGLALTGLASYAAVVGYEDQR